VPLETILNASSARSAARPVWPCLHEPVVIFRLIVIASIKDNLSFFGKLSELLLSKRTIKKFLPAPRTNG
jgi:hypothetical protein